MRSDDEDLSFEEMMTQDGVKPLPKRAATLAGVTDSPTRRSKRRKTTVKSPVGAPPQAPLISGAPGAQPHRSEPDRAPTQKAPAHYPPPESAQTESSRATRQLERDLAAARARTEITELALAETKLALAQARERKRDLMAERSKLDERCRKLSETVRAHQRSKLAIAPLRNLLLERGLNNEREMVLALRGLLTRHPEALLDAFELAAPEQVRHLLEQRLVLVSNHDSSNVDDTCISITVSAERCELTGGSDIRAAFNRLAKLCERADIRAITIVGGSPAYRRQLRALADLHRVPLNLVSGTQRRTRKRADADMRKSDLVVIWGATELDHSVSGVYTSGAAPMLRVPHRGISRMLEQVAGWLASTS